MASGSDAASRYELELRERLAGDYDAAYLAQHGPWFPSVEIAILREALDLGPTDVLADFGSGTGRVSTALAPFCRQVIAFDRSPASLRVLEERARGGNLRNISVVEADLTQPLTEEIRATKAVSVQLLQHIPSALSRRTVMENVHRLLVPGGVCVAENEGFSLGRAIRGRPRTTARPGELFLHTFSVGELRKLILAAGLRPVRVFGCGVMYWTHYAVAPRALTRLEPWASLVPGAHRVAKFTGIVARKP